MDEHYTVTAVCIPNLRGRGPSREDRLRLYRGTAVPVPVVEARAAATAAVGAAEPLREFNIFFKKKER